MSSRIEIASTFALSLASVLLAMVCTAEAKPQKTGASPEQASPNACPQLTSSRIQSICIEKASLSPQAIPIGRPQTEAGFRIWQCKSQAFIDEGSWSEARRIYCTVGMTLSCATRAELSASAEPRGCFWGAGSAAVER